jgi:peptidoglycan hydrolase-like protein with peptidoglycan-binding domain
MRRARRGRRVALIVSAMAVVSVVAAVGALGLGGGGNTGPSTPPRTGSLVAVKRTNLTERTAVDGQLGYGTEIPLPVKAEGTITWLPQEGATVERGGTLLRVDDRPVVLLYGMLPMYRALGLPSRAGGLDPDRRDPGTSDPGRQNPDAPDPGRPDPGTPDPGAPSGVQEKSSAGRRSSGGAPLSAGPSRSASESPPSEGGSDNGAAQAAAESQELRGMDVLQFESNLARLGYTGFTVDERFTAATARAVGRWQKSLGLPQTGTVGVGDIIYSAGRIRIGHAEARLGSPAGGDALTYTSTSRKVVVTASASDAAWAVRGSEVRVQLPAGRYVAGEVASVGRQASAPDGGGGESGSVGATRATVPVTVTVRDQKALGRLESGPVTVEYVGHQAKDVLAVPVSALVALAEGGYGLETAQGRFLAVRTGLFADGDVEVSGTAIREGMKVRIPQ